MPLRAAQRLQGPDVQLYRRVGWDATATFHMLGTRQYRTDNPHIRFYNIRRGYVRTRFTAREMTADFRVGPYVQEPGAPVETRATFVVEDRRPG